MSRLSSTITLFIIALSFSCRTPVLETPEAPVLIKGYLFGGEPIRDFYVERIAISREFESEKNIPLENGQIILMHDEEEILLEPDPNRPGYFYNNDHIVEPNSTYSLLATFEETSVTAKCFVPDTLNIVEDNFEKFSQVGGESDGSLPLMSFSWEELIGYEYLIDLKPEEEELTLLTFSDEIGKFAEFFSLPTSATSAQIFDVDFMYSGRHTLTIYSISQEYSDLLRYIPTSFDRSVYRAPDNIQGAYGVFAGLTGKTYEIFVEEAE